MSTRDGDRATVYSFGDSAVAAERLALVARVFDAPSREWLITHRPEHANFAYGLGCGPGYTTALVAEVTGARRVVGLDASAAFVDRARDGAPSGVEFLGFDVREVPFPEGPADLVFARLLLAHLPAPVALARRWATQLRPGGVLLLDEVERIETSQPTFAAYLRLAAARVAASGAVMCVGPLLRPLAGESGIGSVSMRTREHPVASRDAAAMFAMNLAAWGEEAVRAGLLDRATLAQLSGELARLRSSEASDEIVWFLCEAACQVA